MRSGKRSEPLRVGGRSHTPVAVQIQSAVQASVGAGGKQMWIRRLTIVQALGKCQKGAVFEIPVDALQDQNIGIRFCQNLNHRFDLRVRCAVQRMQQTARTFLR